MLWRESLQSSSGRACLKLLQVFAQGSRALLASSKYTSQGLLELLQMDTGVSSCLFVSSLFLCFLEVGGSRAVCDVRRRTAGVYIWRDYGDLFCSQFNEQDNS